MRTVMAALVAAVAFLLGGAAAAHASCAFPPQPSPHRFVGTVVEVEAGGRLAHVVRDDGSRVAVHGSTELEDGTATSVDRYFAAGGRYEFHPLNASSPFRDNACTATRQLSGPTGQPAGGDASGVLPDWLPVDAQAGPAGNAALLGGGAAVLAAVTVAASMIVRRFRP